VGISTTVVVVALKVNKGRGRGFGQGGEVLSSKKERVEPGGCEPERGPFGSKVSNDERLVFPVHGGNRTKTVCRRIKAYSKHGMGKDKKGFSVMTVQRGRMV